uniref:Uncharacterized protein n=2 Tax=Picea TaxID=3328 RepID=A0A101LXA8_PICGL|nr:hypothetical protein ABT39_MTgene6080 [Picea glauca]QHR89963.1 hypothetical protein Q903MT_gene3985 [Picea sitchensis]
MVSRRLCGSFFPYLLRKQHSLMYMRLLCNQRAPMRSVSRLIDMGNLSSPSSLLWNLERVLGSITSSNGLVKRLHAISYILNFPC